jgi:hypothetical protein
MLARHSGCGGMLISPMPVQSTHKSRCCVQAAIARHKALPA